MFDFIAQVPFPDSTSGTASSFLSEIAKAIEPEAFRLLWKAQWDLALDGQVYATLANVGRGFALNFHGSVNYNYQINVIIAGLKIEKFSFGL